MFRPGAVSGADNNSGVNNMAAILQMLFSNAFLWMKFIVFWLKFHWNLFPSVQLNINQHWFRKWLSVEQSTNHYLNQWWPNSLMTICVIYLRLDPWTKTCWIQNQNTNFFNELHLYENSGHEWQCLCRHHCVYQKNPEWKDIKPIHSFQVTLCLFSCGSTKINAYKSYIHQAPPTSCDQMHAG